MGSVVEGGDLSPDSELSSCKERPVAGQTAVSRFICPRQAGQLESVCEDLSGLNDFDRDPFKGGRQGPTQLVCRLFNVHLNHRLRCDIV